MKQQELEKSKEYKYGFTTDIESIRAHKGLNEEVIRFISKIKKEPEWMLSWRLKAYSRLQNIKEPNNEDFFFNQDIDYDEGIRSPGWARLQKGKLKRIK